jgi:NAD(P)-dependent dehydrogenase (short-subunit alcohol dehydrogenase family)
VADRCVFVTGAGSGIGQATTARLLSKGYTVFAGVINDEEEKGLTANLAGDLHPLLLDVRDGSSVDGVAEEIRARLAGRPLWAVLNIAGVTTNGPLVDLTPETFSQVLAVNVVGVHAVTRACLSLLGPGGRVVNISSASGSRTLPFTGGYSASKFAVEALSAAMRMEFAPLGIRVAVVAPANIQTPMADRIKQELSKPSSLPVYQEPLKRFRKAAEKSFAAGIPVERVVDAIVDAVEAPRPARRYDLHTNYLRDVVLMQTLPVGLREALVRRTLALNSPAAER